MVYYKFLCTGFYKVKANTFEEAVKFVFKNGFDVNKVLLTEVKHKSYTRATKKAYENAREEKIFTSFSHSSGKKSWLVPVFWDVYATLDMPEDTKGVPPFYVQELINTEGWTTAHNYVVYNPRIANADNFADTLTIAIDNVIKSGPKPRKAAKVLMGYYKKCMPHEYNKAVADGTTFDEFSFLTFEDFKNKYAISYHLKFLDAYYSEIAYSAYQLINYQSIYLFLKTRYNILEKIDNINPLLNSIKTEEKLDPSA